MITNGFLELGDPSEGASRNATLIRPHPARSDDLALQQVALAGLEICHSFHDVHCGLSVAPADGTPETIAATDDVPVRLDWLEHELRQGPGVGADPGELVITDLATDQRWPEFGELAIAATNMRSMTCVQIPVARPNRARLSFYSSDPNAFVNLDLRAAARLARLAAPMVRVLISEFGERLLHAPPSDCNRVAIAIGTLIARYRVNSADAFDLLCEASRDLHRALVGVAIDVRAEGRLPEEVILHARRRRHPVGPGQAARTSTRLLKDRQTRPAH
jgi:hypothetical protein